MGSKMGQKKTYLHIKIIPEASSNQWDQFQLSKRIRGQEMAEWRKKKS